MDNHAIIILNFAMLIVLGFFIGYPIYVVIRNWHQKNQLKKETKERAMEQRKQREREDYEQKLFLDIEKTVEKTISTHFKDKKALEWVMINEVDPILNDLPIKRLEAIKQEYEENHMITNIGPFILDKKQLRLWHGSYQKAKARMKLEEQQALARKQEAVKARRKIEAEKARIAKLEKAEKDQKWSNYVEQFRKYNKAQKKSELEWFKKKLVSTYSKNPDEQELYIHELEMIMLEDDK